MVTWKVFGYILFKAERSLTLIYIALLEDLLQHNSEDNGMLSLLEGVDHIGNPHEVLEHPPSLQSGQRQLHHPRVTIPETGGEIYKATLVSLLNEDPQLSHDRYKILPTLKRLREALVPSTTSIVQVKLKHG